MNIKSEKQFFPHFFRNFFYNLCTIFCSVFSQFFTIFLFNFFHNISPIFDIAIVFCSWDLSCSCDLLCSLDLSFISTVKFQIEERFKQRRGLNRSAQKNDFKDILLHKILKFLNKSALRNSKNLIEARLLFGTLRYLFYCKNRTIKKKVDSFDTSRVQEQYIYETRTSTFV